MRRTISDFQFCPSVRPGGVAHPTDLAVVREVGDVQLAVEAQDDRGLQRHGAVVVDRDLLLAEVIRFGASSAGKQKSGLENGMRHRMRQVHPSYRQQCLFMCTGASTRHSARVESRVGSFEQGCR